MPRCFFRACPCFPTLALIGFTLLAHSSVSASPGFVYENITDRANPPVQGNAPSINNAGDVAFYQGASVWFYDRSEGAFLDITSLPGAPAGAWFPKLNNLGNVLMAESSTRDLWLFEAASQSFTNISALSGYPGNSQAHSLQLSFGLNDANQVSFHSGDLNFGQIYVYDHTDGGFEMITNKPGGSWHGRENAINNAGQIAYMGFPSVYLYDPTSGTTTDVNNLPGGPGGLGDSFALNDRGDVAIFRPDQVTYYEAATGDFLFLSTLPGFPPGSASSYGNDLSDRGEITFWRDGLWYFDPRDRSFTQLNDQGPVPVGGMETSINDHGVIALAAGFAFAEDIFLATLIPQADFDADGDVDDDDLTVFAACSTGPALPYDPTVLPAGCVLVPDALDLIDADFDADRDVDSSDFAVIQGCLSGTGLPADAYCAD